MWRDMRKSHASYLFEMRLIVIEFREISLFKLATLSGVDI